MSGARGAVAGRCAGRDRIRSVLRGVVLLLAAGCGGGSEPAEWHQEAGYRWRALEGAGQGTAGFTRMEARAGVRFRNEVGDSALAGNRILGQGAGVALGDVDGDGRVDLFLARTEGPNALYRNRGGWRFEEIAAAAGVAAPDRRSSGAAFADIDGDGDLDLVLLATTGPNAIFVNDGAGRFTERTDLGLDPGGRGGTTPALADVDGDGDLDLYVANYKAYSPVDTIPPQQRAFNQVVRETAPGRFEVVPEHQRDFRLVNRPDMGGLNLTMRGETDQLYRNDGGRFTPVPLDSAEESFSLAARFADLTGDGAPELYVANDFEDPDRLWINDGRGGFRPADWTAQRQTSNSSMGLDVGDVDGDGRPDLFLTDMLSQESRRLKTQLPTHTALPKRPGDLETRLQQQRNTLFLNRGDGTFAEIAAHAGVAATGWSWGTVLLDVDLDGWQDILVATGHLWDVMDADTQERLQNRLSDVPWRRQKWEFPPLPLRNVAFRNRGDLTFEDRSAEWGFGTEEAISHALATADLDDDGDLDVVVNRLRAPALVLRNDAPAPRVAVRLIGAAPNTAAVGARIRVTGGAIPIQEREIAAGGLYLSHSDHLASFATGAADSVAIEVRWRDGRVTALGARPGRLYEIPAPPPGPSARRSAGPPVGRSPPPLFEDLTSTLAGHVHTEPPFDDWERQFLLPNTLAQLGPGVSWFDLDRDGDEDLVIGTGRGGQLGVFRNDRGRLGPAVGRGPVAPADLTTVLGLSTGSGAALLAGVSSWESNTPEAVAAVPGVVRLPVGGAGIGTAVERIVGPDSSTTGPMALADVDGDGDLDLFRGGRAVVGSYPLAPSSALLRNEAGRFVADSAAARTLAGVGLVSAAAFGDVDDDGDPDLLLAREWSSILLLLNDRGRFAPAPDGWGLGRWTSRWNGIATGDLDGDGRLDLVATSWGRNTATPADSARPLVMIHGRFGSGGEVEMLLARADSAGALRPLNGYPRVRVAVKDLVSRVGTFGAYADAAVEQVLGPAATSAGRAEAVTLDQMAFLNRGGRFEARPLPREAQLAPAFSAGIADFDGDGREDVILSQNFFPTAVGLPRYDGGRGLLLRGDGEGGLSAMAGAESGLLVYGDQRGAAHADFDGDGRLDWAVSQNGAATRLFRNAGAKPGLRVRLIGPPGNPDQIGARLRLVYRDRLGPIREVQAGSGYWSQNGAVQVLGFSEPPAAVLVRWPGGGETRVAVPPGAREVTARR